MDKPATNNSGLPEIASLTVDFLPGFVNDPITFSLTVYADGMVDYKAKPGYGLDDLEQHEVTTYTKTIPKATIDQIVQLLNRNDFFALRERYDDYTVTDMPYYSIKVTKTSGKGKKVLVYGGHIADESSINKFYAIYNEIINLSSIKQWLSLTFGDKNPIA
ncbi:MAG: DUF6438 domain-containing protein [Nitrososphaera sp.]